MERICRLKFRANELNQVKSEIGTAAAAVKIAGIGH